MDYDDQLKVQALLDGELPEAEAPKVKEWVARDREATALLEELRQTGAALREFEADIRLPESREFFWSKIEREIQRQEAAVPQRAPVPLLTLLRRWMVPASAFALLFVVAVVLNRPAGPSAPAAGPATETMVAGSGAFTYHDYSAGTTLVWLSYPADNEPADDDEMGALE